MTRYDHSGNAAPTTLSTSITNVSTSINLVASTGWPSGSSGPFWATIDAGTASEEHVLVLSRSGLVLTVSARGADGTTATSHSMGATIEHTFSATEADAANAHIEATTGHGATGAVVGTTNTQTLTNKTVNLASNTLTGTLAQFNAAVSDADLASLAGAETLTNKTINLGSNTLTMTKAQLNTAVSDADVATLTGTETLTSKTLASPVLTGTTTGGTMNLSGPLQSTSSLAAYCGGNGEIILGYNGSGGLSIAQGGPATHSNGIVLWVSGNSLYARKSNGADVLLVA